MFAWRARRLPDVGVAGLLLSLSVEGLPYRQIPPGKYDLVIGFRHKSRLERRAMVARYFREEL